MKAVIYARYSSDSQREESIEGQLRECLEFANKIGVDVVANYIDARNDTIRRISNIPCHPVNAKRSNLLARVA